MKRRVSGLRQRPLVAECSACRHSRGLHADAEQEGFWGVRCTAPTCTCWRPMFKVTPPLEKEITLQPEERVIGREKLEAWGRDELERRNREGE